MRKQRIVKRTSRSTPKSTSGVLGKLEEKSLSDFTSTALKIYGVEVIEQRALPDFRDGLKPVHRAILYSMYTLHINNKGGFKKSARVVGDVIGKYHPHSDTAAYSAMVGLTGVKRQGVAVGWSIRNCSTPLIEGQGNFGDFNSMPAAMRYTEAKLSKFSDMMLLDPDYMAVIDYIPNYDDSEKMPVVLPAKLPVLLLNGFQSIAVGVAASSPPFALPGVIDITKRALSGEKLTALACARTLKFDHPYGGTCVSSVKESLPLFKGKGRAFFIPEYTIDSVKHTLTFTSVCPGLMSTGTLQTFLEKLSLIKGVSSVDDLSDKKGVRYFVTVQRGIKGTAFDDVIDKCLALAERSDAYDLGVTTRSSDGTATFKNVAIPEMMEMWAQWRIELEVKVLTRLIGIHQAKLDRYNLLVIAVDNLEVIIAALRVKANTVKIKQGKELVEVDASAAYLMKHLKLTLEQANVILDLKVRSLRSMEKSKLLLQIKDTKLELKTLNVDLKQPATRIIADLDTFSKIKL